VPLPYEITVNITRERARELIAQLIEDPYFRERLEADTLTVLSEHGIVMTPESLPEQVRLPDPDAIREFLSLLETRIAPEPATPFGIALLVLIFGAMPVLEGNRPALNGSG
jgi:hypothetical protein